MRKAVWADLYQPLICEVCGHEGAVGRRPLMFAGWACEFCFFAWYDYGLTDREVVAKKSMELRAASAAGAKERLSHEAPRDND